MDDRHKDDAEGMVIGDYGIERNCIHDKCPLEAYDAQYIVNPSKPVINRRAISNAFSLKERSPLREEYESHVSTLEPVAPAVEEMKELVMLIGYSEFSETYYAPNGNSYTNHPSKINEFIQRVADAGGNILSIQTLSNQIKYSVHYQVPVGTYPINV